MTSSLRPGHLLRAAFVLGITSGCGSSLGPTDLVGRYTLARVNEAPPPQVVGATISCDLLLTGGRLELRTSDWSALTLDQRRTAVASAARPQSLAFSTSAPFTSRAAP